MEQNQINPLITDAANFYWEMRRQVINDMVARIKPKENVFHFEGFVVGDGRLIGVDAIDWSIKMHLNGTEVVLSDALYGEDIPLRPIDLADKIAESVYNKISGEIKACVMPVLDKIAGGK
jgi:hypothetical protein